MTASRNEAASRNTVASSCLHGVARLRRPLDERGPMQVDWRVGVLVIVAVLAVILLAGIVGTRSGATRAGDSGGPPACPPGHVTSQGCEKP